MKRFYVSLIFLGMLVGGLSAQLSILLVNDNGYSTAVDSVKNSMDRLGVSYSLFDAAIEGMSPSAELMKGFDLVYWHTGNDGAALYLWNGDETENQAIMDFVDDGGILWVEGCDFLHDKYSATPQAFFTGEFVYDYMGISNYFGQSKNDDDGNGLPKLDVVADNGIFTQDTIAWRWSGHWYADALEKTDNASNIYQMGPSDYALRDYYSAIYNEKGDGKVLSFAFRFDGIDTISVADTLMMQGINYFSQFVEEKTLVSSISIETEGGSTGITKNGGTLQLSASVLPEDADLKAIEWSIASDGVYATISIEGLLTASGTSNGNGTVTVTASSVDGSDVSESVDIAISNQGGEFVILLVNDNANGLDRYMVLDTTLNNLGYLYKVYNTAETGTYPSSELIKGYDFVIWYTGNDGVSLNLWGVADTTGQVNTGLKFNPALMEYTSNGGDVWIQGLDFMFDIYGAAPAMFEAGDFVYDMMGIKTYVAQSHADGDDLAQLDVVSGNPVVNFTPVKDQFGGLWYADVFEITEDAQGIYNAGPSDYVYADYYSGFLTTHGESEIFTLSYETARMDSRGNMEIFFDDVIEYFEDQYGVGIEESAIDADNGRISIYPNPVADQLHVILEEGHGGASLRLINLLGQEVFSAKMKSGVNEYSISRDAGEIASGLYILSVEAEFGNLTRKVIFE